MATGCREQDVVCEIKRLQNSGTPLLFDMQTQSYFLPGPEDQAYVIAQLSVLMDGVDWRLKQAGILAEWLKHVWEGERYESEKRKVSAPGAEEVR